MLLSLLRMSTLAARRNADSVWGSQESIPGLDIPEESHRVSEWAITHGFSLAIDKTIRRWPHLFFTQEMSCDVLPLHSIHLFALEDYRRV